MGIFEWQKPVTTRKYLHAPRSERMFTMWSEGKIVMDENIKGVDSHSYSELECAVLCPVYSVTTTKKKNNLFDFRRAEHIMPENCAPIHEIKNTFGGFEVSFEAFCNTERKSTCFIKIKVKNTADFSSKGNLGFIVRRGKEEDLVFGSPDEYVSYAPESALISQYPATFEYKDGMLRDGDVFVTVDSPSVPYEYYTETGTLWFSVTLNGGEEKEIIMSFGKGEAFDFRYSEEKNKAESFWARELERINTLPKKISKDAELLRTVRGLAVQIIQCFSYYVGEDFLVSRQGGLQRLVWPIEAMYALEALSRIGDFDDYIKEIIEFYFGVRQKPDGEIENIGENWASVTFGCLYTLASYCTVRNDIETWNKYRDRAFLAFEWIKKKRAESLGIEGATPGLFPPMRGNDWGEIFQHYTNTDSHGLMAIRKFFEAAEYFKDSSADEVLSEYNDYKNAMVKMFEPHRKAAEGLSELRIPLTPSGNDKPLLDAFYPNLCQGIFAYAAIDDKNDLVRASKYLENHGMMKNWLHGHMPYKDGSTHIWYTLYSDYYWFLIYLGVGDTEAAKNTLDAMLRYSVTTEYYVIERYCDNDPYYLPWSPNASGAGRIILSLLEYYTGV